MSSASRPVFARLYAWTSPKTDAGGIAGRRAELLSGLGGKVIEVGAGNGLNFRHYPPTVTKVVAVEPERRLRALGRRAAETAPVPVEVVDGAAERLPGSGFDAAVVSLTLCSVADQVAALREMYRIVKPGGELRFLEHVRGETRALQRVQRILDATIWPFFSGGCHSGRDTARAIADAGFTIEHLTKFRFPDARPSLPTSPHIIGVARKPEAPADQRQAPH